MTPEEADAKLEEIKKQASACSTSISLERDPKPPLFPRLRVFAIVDGNFDDIIEYDCCGLQFFAWKIPEAKPQVALFLMDGQTIVLPASDVSFSASSIEVIHDGE